MLFFFFFNDTATTEIYTLSLHDALPIQDVENEVNLSYLDNELKDSQQETKRRVPRAFVGTPLWDYDATGENVGTID